MPCQVLTLRRSHVHGGPHALSIECFAPDHRLRRPPMQRSARCLCCDHPTKRGRGGNLIVADKRCAAVTSKPRGEICTATCRSKPASEAHSSRRACLAIHDNVKLTWFSCRECPISQRHTRRSHSAAAASAPRSSGAVKASGSWRLNSTRPCAGAQYLNRLLAVTACSFSTLHIAALSGVCTGRRRWCRRGRSACRRERVPPARKVCWRRI